MIIASRVYLLEPALDPAVEVQAAGRIHRLGQNKPSYRASDCMACNNIANDNRLESPPCYFSEEKIVNNFVHNIP